MIKGRKINRRKMDFQLMNVKSVIMANDVMLKTTKTFLIEILFGY